MPRLRSYYVLHLVLQDFVQGLSVLCRGSVEDKLRWTFTLYDINGDGRITREEMTNIVTAIYELMGKFAETVLEDDSVANRVDCVFKVRTTRPILQSTLLFSRTSWQFETGERREKTSRG